MRKHVVVPLDRSAYGEPAVGVGAAVAAATGAELELLSVCSAAAAGATAQYLAEQRALVPEGVVVSTTVLPAEQATADVIAAHLEERAEPLLCLRSHGRPPLTELVLGSTSDALLRSTSHPVLLLGPRYEGGPLRVGRGLVCLDGTGLDDAVAAAAVDWALQLRGELRFVHCDPTRRGSATDLVETRVLEALDAGIPATGCVVASERVAAALVHEATASACDALVVGVRRHLPLVRRGLGATALRVVHRARRPVLAVS